MTITGGSALPKDDIERMIRDAESHADEDRRRREAAETRNQGDQLVYQTEKLLREHGEGLPAELTAKVESALGELREALKGEDLEIIRQRTEALAQVSQELGQAIYQATTADAAAGAPQAGQPSGAGAEDVVDAEVVDEGGDEEQAAS